MTPSRRALALVVALLFASAGGGLPMCLTLVHRAAQPCDMHGHDGHGAPAGDGEGAELRAAADAQSCHAAEAAPGCAAGGACPAGNLAAPAVLAPDLFVALASDAAHARLKAPASFLAPPLSPPPQA